MPGSWPSWRSSEGSAHGLRLASSWRRTGRLVNDHSPPIIYVRITDLAGGLYSVTTPDSGATLVDRTRNPLEAACAALHILGYGPACLLGITMPISTAMKVQ
jgi:hypothetical protein